ncbi:prenyltransferase [Nocardiopsis changdeensis]|uniref:Prenyltransferase n=1 Tax=Nocardiopsis changdeensis TaxID=2831969 RepID=A0ABX8BLD8_9ACTN|nr:MULTISPECIES: prenyltransferase [Nocardiopsis]QUX21711.1 prenyltransferase [Nocardiopsis changdeensis]QYX37646.1 prenyltransferase [Nocardiopsis sp. MT53]
MSVVTAPDDLTLRLPGVLDAGQLLRSADYLARSQEATGALPWFPGGHTDVWDHVECAMALTVTGLWEPAHAAAARRAYRWLAGARHPGGGWPAKFRQGVPATELREANHAAYPAVGAFHHLLVTGDTAFAEELWPVVEDGLEFVLALRGERGEILWARGEDGSPGDHALLTVCASVHHALRCGAALGERLGRPRPEWTKAADRLSDLINDDEDLFADRGRFSMDWFYPILGGAVRGEAAHARLAERWDRFVVPGLGVRCVDDQPWVTAAETSELVLALAAVGRTGDGVRILREVQHLRDGDDGVYWTGYQFAEQVRWPVERSTWTTAAVILAVDALTRTTPGSQVFLHTWDG